MASAVRTRSETTRAALLEAAREEFSAFGFRRSSMESVARRAGVSRATLYLHCKGKQELFRALVEQLHEEHLAAMEAAMDEPGLSLSERTLAMLQARYVRFVEMTSASPYAVELYDLHGRLCGDVARTCQERSERLLARMLRDASARGEADLGRCRLSAPKVAGVLLDCAHGAKGEDPASATPEEFRERLARSVRVLMAGIAA